MKRQYLFQSVTKNSKKRQDKTILIGWLILAILLLLSGCSRIEYVYVEPEKVPVTCIDHIKTPLDMAKCLEEYKVRY